MTDAMRWPPKSVTIPLAVGLYVLVYRGPGHLWVRGSLGDVAALTFLVGVLGWATQRSLRWRLLAVGALAIGLECLQLVPEAKSLPGWASFLVGSHFDGLDFFYYALGLVAGWLLDSR